MKIPWNKLSLRLIQTQDGLGLSEMSVISIDGLSTAADLLVRAQELEQLASLVSYGADKARLLERANRLRAEATHLPGPSRGSKR